MSANLRSGALLLVISRSFASGPSSASLAEATLRDSSLAWSYSSIAAATGLAIDGLFAQAAVKASMRALESKFLLMSSIIGTSADFVVVLNPEGNFEVCNKPYEFAQFLGHEGLFQCHLVRLSHLFPILSALNIFIILNYPIVAQQAMGWLWKVTTVGGSRQISPRSCMRTSQRCFALGCDERATR